MNWELVVFFLGAFISLFTIVNPMSTAVVFLSLTQGFSKEEKRATAMDAAKTSFLILVFFALTGLLLFKWMNFTIGSFKIMGGLFLFRTAWLMLQGEGKSVHEQHTRSEITIVPLAIPLISGPGAIVTAVVLFNEAPSMPYQISVILAIVLVTVLTGLILQNSHHVVRVLHEKGIRVLNKLMGLILGSIAVQFIINGISDTIPLLLKIVQ